MNYHDQLLNNAKVIADVNNKLKALVDACAPRPYYAHDCSKCKFHGTFDDRAEGSAEFLPVDVYTCDQLPNIGFATIIMRHSSTPSDNVNIELRRALDKFYTRAIHANSWALSEYDKRVEKALGLILTNGKPS